MYRIKDVQEALIGLVGWQQSYDTTDFRIADRLTRSETGLYYQQAHPLLTLRNISDIAPDFKNTVYPEYSQSEKYGKGNVVTFSGNTYKALKDVTGVQPGTDPLSWGDTNPFSEWLEEKTKASIAKAVARFCTEKVSGGVTKPIFENRALFDGTGRISDTEPNRKNLVGFEIVTLRSRSVTTRLNKIGLQFTEPGEYTLYLMHSSMDAPVKVMTFTKIRRGSVEWFPLDDVYLPYMGEDNDAGGSWYLCYSQSELPEGSQAIRKNKDWSKGPCPACGQKDYSLWKMWSKFMEIHPFYVNEELLSGTRFNEDYNDDFDKQPLHMWDVENNLYVYDTNFGINLEITVSCDITDFIIEQRGVFADVLQKQVAVDMLREFAYNPSVRANRHSINASRSDILYELDGDASSMQKSGLSYQLDNAYKAIDFGTRGIDRICLPCKKVGIKYGTI